MILQAHPTGNAFALQLADGLVDARLLSEYWTGLDYPSDDRWLRFLPASLLQEGRRRRLPDSIKPFAHIHPLREVIRLFGHRLGLHRLMRHETGPLSVDAVYQAFDRRVAARVRRHPGLRAVYLYEDGAAATFAAARERNLRTFYDLPIGYWRAARHLLLEEAELSPDWAATLAGNADSPAKLARKDNELALADTIFVASSFTRATLADAPSRPRDIVVVPYGAPSIPPGLVTPALRAPDEPLRVLFVGSLGQRKGTRYLLEAMQRLGPGFELTLIGRPPSARCDPLAAGLARYRHIPTLPHAEILAEMGRHHVLVFPSLFEGFGLVLLEAMACGLPVIATAHTAAPDIVREGRDGFIIPIRSADAIAKKLTWFADDEDRRQAFSECAREQASTFTWTRYQAEMLAALRLRLNLAGPR